MGGQNDEMAKSWGRGGAASARWGRGVGLAPEGGDQIAGISDFKSQISDCQANGLMGSPQPELRSHWDDEPPARVPPLGGRGLTHERFGSPQDGTLAGRLMENHLFPSDLLPDLEPKHERRPSLRPSPHPMGRGCNAEWRRFMERSSPAPAIVIASPLNPPQVLLRNKCPHVTVDS